MESIIIIAVLCIAFTLYAVPFGITKISQDEFLLMNKSAEINQYNDTTVAYNLQITVTVYFFWWGFKFGLSNTIFIMTWMFGLLIFGLYSGRLAKLISNKNFDGSLFSVLAKGGRTLRRFMSILFIFSIVGTQFVELYFTSDFIQSVTKAQLGSSNSSHLYFWVSFAFLAFVVLWYCSLGGVRKVVATDTWQLSIAYVGAAIFIAALGPRINEYAGSQPMRLVSCGMALLFLIMALAPSIASFLVSDKTKHYRHTSLFTLGSLFVSALISLLPLILLAPQSTHTAPIQFIFPKPFLSIFVEPLGWAPVVGFTVINLLWQFSDYTAYHRLALLDLPEDQAAKAKKLRESIFVTMINSPLTWGLGIFAGMAVDATGLLPSGTNDVFGDFAQKAAELVKAGDPNFRISLAGLAAFLGAVLLSTVDSGFMSVVLIIVRDLSQKALSPIARFIVNLSVIALMALLAELLVEFQIDILVFVNATYAWGLVFAALSILALYQKSIKNEWIYTSLILGAAAASIITFNPWNLLPELASLVAPSLAAIAVSSSIIVIAFLIKPDSIQE